MQCEMCGSSSPSFKVDVEGTVLTVCKSCSRFGRVLSRLKPPAPAKKRKEQKALQKENKPAPPRRTLIIVENFPKLIKNARERLGLKQKDLAKQLAVKESTLHHLESGDLEPSIDMARRIEKHLRIRLVEEVVEDDSGVDIPPAKGEALTIGDAIRVRKRKK